MAAYAGADPAFSVRETEELAGIRIGHTKLVGVAGFEPAGLVF